MLCPMSRGLFSAGLSPGFFGEESGRRRPDFFFVPYSPVPGGEWTLRAFASDISTSGGSWNVDPSPPLFVIDDPFPPAPGDFSGDPGQGRLHELNSSWD